MTRLEGWEARLVAFVDARRDMPFEWGGNDCCSFAIAAVAEITGETIWPVDWSTVAEALRAIEDAGGLIEAWTATLGRPSQNWMEIRRGDVALVEIAGRLSISVSLGHVLCGPGPDRLEFLPLDQARHSWRVG